MKILLEIFIKTMHLYVDHLNKAVDTKVTVIYPKCHISSIMYNCFWSIYWLHKIAAVTKPSVLKSGIYEGMHINMFYVNIRS